jgi:hypothetical protein
MSVTIVVRKARAARQRDIGNDSPRFFLGVVARGMGSITIGTLSTVMPRFKRGLQ